MGSGASAVENVKGKDGGAIAAGVQGLSANDKAVLRAAWAAMEAGGDGVASNLKQIAENEGQLHKLYLTVMTNKQGIYQSRSMIEQNRFQIAKNYSAAFVGNRQMANENTDTIFKNRIAILDALKVDGAVQENFRNSMHNEATIEYLENRSLLNNRVAKVNEKMVEANADLIAINSKILESNEEIVTFNTQQIETNKRLLDGVQADKATPEANATRIASNKERIAKLDERNKEYNAKMQNKHSLIKQNRKDLEENDKNIKERRKEILKNREAIMENGETVASIILASAMNVTEVTAKLATLSDEEKANLRTALSAGAEGEAVTTNRKNISENEAKLHTLYLDVMSNKEQLYMIRAIIEENRALVLKNYAAAFIGNRQMANQNTDDIFKNRIAILDALKTEGQVQENFRNSKYNEATIDFLDHRSKLNNRVAKVNEMMATLNTKLIEINSAIMLSNEEIVGFNSRQIEANKGLLKLMQEGQSPADGATPETNATRIAENAKRMQVIADRNAKYEEKTQQMLAKAKENRSKIDENAKVIEDRRAQILTNRANISANGQKVAELLKA